MILDARKGFRGKVFDLNTGQEVRGVIWLDTEKGELEAYAIGPDNKPVATMVDGLLYFRRYTAKGRFRVTVGSDSQRPPRVVMGASNCARCHSTLTLPGDDLCPGCRADQQWPGQGRMRVERVINPLLDRKCHRKGCSRLAEWSVCDEVGVTPACVRGVTRIFGRLFVNPLYDRGATVGRRFYCSKHWQPPRLLDARGDRMEDIEVSVRPQW